MVERAESNGIVALRRSPWGGGIGGDKGMEGTNVDFSKRLYVVAEPDVLVCGCGSAGIAATIAAARHGARTLAIERWGFAGGYMTAVFGPGMDGFVDLRSGLPVVGGVAFEFARLAGGATGDIAHTRFQPGSDLRELDENAEWRPMCLDVELFKLHADRLMRAAGAQILYHTVVADALAENGHITGVVIANKGGLGIIRPKVVVDATGDADVAAFAGAEYAVSEVLQPMSLHFRIRGVQGITARLREKCAAALKQGSDAGRLPLYGGPWMGQVNADELWINATRIPGSGLNPKDVTHAEIRGREDAWTMFELWKEHVSEFRDAIFVTSGPVVGVRETRRIVGDETIRREDILAKKAVADAVVLGAWYLDRHPDGKSGYHIHEVVRPYGIGYRTLLPRGADNLLVAGRCHSADSAALASTRVNITAMGMGQAAGTAAALCAAGRTSPREVSIGTLQSELLKDGVIILERAEEILRVGDACGDRIPESKPR